MASTLDTALITIVPVSLLIFIASCGNDLYQCQMTKLRYERIIVTLRVMDAPNYLREYQQACHIKQLTILLFHILYDIMVLLFVDL
jgi:hypothetical protein